MKSVDFRAGGPGMVQIFAAILAAGLMAPANAARAATLEEIKKRGYMIVATEDDYPPFEFVKDGKPDGLDHELVELLKEAATFRDPAGDPALARPPRRRRDRQIRRGHLGGRDH